MSTGSKARGGDEKETQDRSRLEKAWEGKHRSPKAFLHARNGDHAMIPFECDVCIFRKIRGRSPLEGDPIDALLTGCIRRANLDAFWSSASATVNGNRDRLVAGLRLSELVGLQGPYVHEGPLPDHDHCGYEVAVQMLLYSKRPGKRSVSSTV
jgi:hypothetical protein